MTRLLETLPMTSAYFSLIVRELGATARDRAALLEGTGIRDDARSHASSAEITLGQQLRQVRNASRRHGRDWALGIAGRFHAATHGPIGIAAVSAPTLRRTLEVITRFSSVRAPHFRLRAVRGRGETRLVPEDRIELSAQEHRPLLDVVLLSTQGMIEGALGRPMRGGRIDVAAPAPGRESRWADVFHAPVRFGCRQSAVVVPDEWLDLPCPLGDAHAFDDAVARLAIGERRLTAPDRLGARVEALLAEPQREVGAAGMARLVGRSRRSLARHLRRDGTSFRELRDAARRRRAQSLLRERGLGLAEVGWALGYQDAASFGRACRRWFGASPGHVRRRLLDGE